MSKRLIALVLGLITLALPGVALAQAQPLPYQSTAFLEANAVDTMANYVPSTSGTPAAWVGHVFTYFTSDFDRNRALAVIPCESGWKTDADNPYSTARGGWQFLKSTWELVQSGSGYDLDDYPDGPDDPQQATMAAAWLVYEGGGWGHWNASKSCWDGLEGSVEYGAADLTSVKTEVRD